MEKIGTDCIRAILKNVDPTFFKFMSNSLDKVVFAQNHLVCDVTIILSVKEFHFAILNSWLTKDFPLTPENNGPFNCYVHKYKYGI